MLSAQLGLTVLVAVLSACAPAERACTLIGSVPGVGVRVEPAAAEGLTALRLRICLDATQCRDVDVPLDPGSTPVGETCTGTRPDDACSVSMAPDGTLVGFAMVEELTTAPVQVGGQVRRSGRWVQLATVEVLPAMTYPNGPDCGGGSPQAQVRLTPDGLQPA